MRFIYTGTLILGPLQIWEFDQLQEEKEYTHTYTHTLYALKGFDSVLPQAKPQRSSVTRQT